MFMGLGMPIPDLSNKPGPGRPGWSAGSYDFQFEVAAGQVGITVLPYIGGQGFTVKWQDGTEQFINAGTTNLQSPTTDAGIISINKKTDQGFCDDFAVVSGKEFVTKVISWGQNPWNRLQEAFKDCTNLTDISTTSLITGSGCVLTSAFQSCTSLAEVNISSWDMTNAARIDQMFDACTGLEVMETGSLNLNLNHTSQFWLRGTGTAVTNGCEYKMSGLNITATGYAASNMTNWWVNMKINPSSSFANISWPSVVHAQARFSSSSITGVNSTLDCSGWTNYNSTIFPSFSSVVATEGGASNMKINITNLSVSNITSFNRSFLASGVSEIIGLNSLGASGGISNIEYAFYLCGFLDFSNSNFSNAFINSFSLTSVPTQAFIGVGASLSSGSAPPNLGSLNISGVSALTEMFLAAKFSSAPDFSNVVMSTTNPYDFNSTFRGMNILDTSNIDSLFAKTFKVSSFESTFQECQISSITMGSGVDFSPCTTMTKMFQQTSSSTNIELPTNMDLGNITGVNGFQYTFLNGPTLSTCQVDNFIRRLHATALTNGLAIDFNNAAVTESPSVVRGLLDDLENPNGWSITVNSTDATIPFEYTGTLAPNTIITPTNNTGSPFTGTKFSSTNSNIAVNATTGVINTPNGGNTTIRYTLDDGCYTEQAISLVSAEFSYSASAYCQDAATDPIPTVTGTSGGIFTAVLKVIPFQMQFEVASNTEKIIEVSCSSTGNFTIDWGDNSTILNNYTTGVITHTYNAGNSGTTIDPVISFGDTNDTGVLGDASPTNTSKPSLIDVPQWGNMEFNIYAFQDRFKGCSNSRFQISATDAPNIATGVVNMKNLFYYANPAFNSDISHWNANVGASFSYAFSPITSFNQPLNSWDVSNATTLHSAFYDATSFNQPLNSWDVSNVLGNGLTSLFYRASSFNQYLGDWDIQTSGLNFFRSSGMSTANYTDTFVSWANKVYNNSGPYNLNFGAQVGMTFDRSRSGGSNFADAGAARDYLTGATANWTITSDQEIN